MNELFDDNLYTNNFVARLTLLVPEFGNVLSRIFSVVSNVITFINTKLLPLISKKQLDELPIMWFANRVHTIVDQRLETPTSQVDLLQLMLKVLVKKVIHL